MVKKDNIILHGVLLICLDECVLRHSLELELAKELNTGPPVFDVLNVVCYIKV